MMMGVKNIFRPSSNEAYVMLIIFTGRSINMQSRFELDARNASNTVLTRGKQYYIYIDFYNN